MRDGPAAWFVAIVSASECVSSVKHEAEKLTRFPFFTKQVENFLGGTTVNPHKITLPEYG